MKKDWPLGTLVYYVQVQNLQYKKHLYYKILPYL